MKLAKFIGLLLLLPIRIEADEAVLARLSFWMPPERVGEFEAIYEAQLAPILAQRDLVASSERGRITADGVYSRLFALDHPAEMAAKDSALQEDPAWQQALAALARVWGTAGADSLLQYRFSFYAVPATFGKTVAAGPGQTVRSGAGLRQGVWQTYSIGDGFASSSVWDIHQDRAGELWFATQQGIIRYDGASFTNFTGRDGLGAVGTDSFFRDIIVFSILEDRQEHLWFGTYGGGVSHYDGHSFTTYTARDGLAHDNVTSIVEDRQGHLWFGSSSWSPGGGVSRWDGEAFTTFTTADGLASDNVTSILEDRRGHLWFGTYGGGVSHWDGEAFTTFTTRDGLADDKVASVLEDRRGHLWFGTYGGGVSRWDGATFTTFDTRDGLNHLVVMSLFESSGGDLWFGTYGGGVSRWDGEAFTTFDTRDGLGHNRVVSIFEDRTGNLWFGTDGGGLSRYNGRSFAIFTTEDGLVHDQVFSMLEDSQGGLWFGTYGGGVSRYDGETFHTIKPFDAEAYNLIVSMQEHRPEQIWIRAEEDSIARYDHGENRLVKFAVEDRSERRLMPLADLDDYLWFDVGLVFRREGDRLIKDGFLAEHGLNDVGYIFKDGKGGFWFGSAADGAAHYDGEHLTSFSLAEGLGHYWVVDIAEDRRGDIWFATRGGGVTRYDGERLETFTTQVGLAHDDVVAIAEDDRGHLWFGTWGGGVSQYDGFAFQNLFRRDGLVSNAVRTLLYDRNGNLWIGTDEGVVRYRPTRIAPNIQLTDVVTDRRLGSVENIRLPTSQDYIAFEFEGRSLTTHWNQMVYAYRLSGPDRGEEWLQTREMRVEYLDIPVGEYAFEVRAIDQDLNYSAPVRVGVTVHLPYDRLAWGGAWGLAVLLIVWQARRLVQRDRRLRESNDELRGEIHERERVELERERLDEQLERLRYLERLRSALEGLPSKDEAIGRVGDALLVVLKAAPPGGVRVECDGRAWEFGLCGKPGQQCYEKPFGWGERERGGLAVFCGVALSETQERTLLDETAGLVARVLEAQELTAQLLQSARLVSLGQMAAGVAHELNQPLSAISTVAGDVDMRLGGGQEVEQGQLREMMRKILGMVDRMAGTIDHLRTFSRDMSEEPSVRFAINEVVHSSLQVIGTQLKNHGIEVALELVEGLPALNGQPQQVEQVLLNLLANARDALDEKGGDKRISIRTRLGDEGVVVEVEDFGAGIEAEDLPRIFEPFFTTKDVDKGMGLGLAISYAIVRNHDGQIVCVSRPGEGTVFRVVLPSGEED